MIRRFNYTGRHKINREHVRIVVRHDRDGTATFSAELALGLYHFPGDACVFVEAYRQTSFMRFPWGTATELAPPTDCSLSEFGPPDGVLFRVKVVEAGGQSDPRPARLLGVADQLRPQHLPPRPQEAESLLPVVPADIREIWRIDFPSDRGEPVLEINRNLVANPTALVRSGPFVSLVLPELLRIVLTRILLLEGCDDSGQGDDWRALWLRMARLSLEAGEAPRPELDEHGGLTNREELEGWVEGAVGLFSDKFKVTRRLVEWWEEGEQS